MTAFPSTQNDRLHIENQFARKKTMLEPLSVTSDVLCTGIHKQASKHSVMFTSKCSLKGCSLEGGLLSHLLWKSRLHFMKNGRKRKFFFSILFLISFVNPTTDSSPE
uniref:Uncharacterized protein n=1 Tax=Sphaerodactylus townsendi TaxID=933632 RepID=A0ACB8EPS8_9SAUR